MNKAPDIAQLASILAAAGVTIYVLGLVGLALSIRFSFTQKWATAWYAASMMPRTVVAGQGVRVWRQGIFSAVILVVLTFGGIIFLVQVFGWNPIEAAGFGVLVGLFNVLNATDTIRRRTAQTPSESEEAQPTEPPPIRLRTVIVMAIVGVLIVIVAGFVVYRAVQVDLAPALKMKANWNNVTIGTLFFFIGAFFMAVPLSKKVEAPLPAMVFTDKGEPEHSGAPVPVSGRLIAHADGYWHFFDSQRGLVSIPDDRVAEVKIYDAFYETDAASREQAGGRTSDQPAPTPDEERSGPSG
jgi:hypothetical protein